jgi:hypothetical protein
MAFDTLKVIYRARNGPEAHLLQNALEAAGIKAVVHNAALESGAGAGIVGWPALPRVLVAAADAQAARRMALAFERSLSDREDIQAEVAETPEEPGEPAWWPRCPGCGAPRLAQCRSCGTAGTGFRSADPAEGESSPQPAGRLVICPTCDEAATPAYLQQCEWCGHRFADGLPPPEDAFQTEWTWRLVIAVIALIAAVAGMIAYFAWLV